MSFKPAQTLTPLLFGALLFFTASPSAQAWEIVEIDEEVVLSLEEPSEDVIAIGGVVEITGATDHDLVVVGGEVSVHADVEGEAVIGGGDVDVAGNFANELVMFGGDIRFRGATADEFVATGGAVTIAPEAVISGESGVYGGDVSLQGTFTESLDAAAGIINASGQFTGHVVLSGQDVSVSGAFANDVVIEGADIIIEEGARFSGSLKIRSPKEPELPVSLDYDEALYTYEHIARYDQRVGDMRLSEIITAFKVVFIGIAIFLCFFGLIALMIVVASKRITTEASAAFRHAPLQSFLIGLLALLASIILGAILIIIVIGPLLMITFMMVGFFITSYSISTLFFKNSGKPLGAGARLGYSLLGMILLMVVSAIPILGAITTPIAVIMGMGAFSMALFGKAPSVGDTRMLEPEPEMDAFDDGHPPEPGSEPLFEDDEDQHR